PLASRYLVRTFRHEGRHRPRQVRRRRAVRAARPGRVRPAGRRRCCRAAAGVPGGRAARRRAAGRPGLPGAGHRAGRVVIAVVGASAAGLTAPQTLRREGYDGPLTVIGAEGRMPYDRPPLSKQILAGDWEPSKITLPCTVDGVEWKLGVRAAGLDVGGRRLALSTGDDLPYDKLVIATGVTPRRLPFGQDLAGVHTLRTLEDTLAFKEEL